MENFASILGFAGKMQCSFEGCSSHFTLHLKDKDSCWKDEVSQETLSHSYCTVEYSRYPGGDLFCARWMGDRSG